LHVFATKFQDPTLSGASIAPILEMCIAAMFVLSTVEIWGGLQLHDVHSKIHVFRISYQ